ncbi:MAG: class I SAM-dependent methyltransferase [Anaerolineae bacterium]|nr:class I SAM-dependent methyltransferase [Anaerolineae bacterium]
MDKDYVAANKEAWEEAFPVHQRGRKANPVDVLQSPEGTFLDAPVIAALERIGVAGKAVGQLCCNNGRELLSIVKMGAASGVGFDLAENFIEEAGRITRETGLNARFICTDIADIPTEFANAFDWVVITAGALCWFHDLGQFFRKAAQVLAPQGHLLIHEIHPFINMLAYKTEPGFDEAHPSQAVYSYFKDDAWIETDGMDYVGGTTYASKPFTSFSHTMGAIISAVAQSGLEIVEMHEYPDDISAGCAHLSGRDLPLSYLLLARKR